MTALRVALWLAGALALSPASAAAPFDGRWSIDPQACDSEDNAMLLLIVTPLLLRWRGDACAIRTSYRVRNSWHIGARCWSARMTSDIPIKLQIQGERLVLDWAGAPALELQRCP